MMRRFLHLQSGEISGSQLSSENAENQSSQADGLAASPGPGHLAGDLKCERPTEPGGRAFPSFGEKACGVSFNPSHDPVVDEIKKKSAELVDLIHSLRLGVTGEAARYYSKAISHIEDGQMNAVKGKTWQH